MNQSQWKRIHEKATGVLPVATLTKWGAALIALLLAAFLLTQSVAIGTASSVSGQDQERLVVGFHRLIFPDGRWVALEFTGLNQLGEGALKDQVNRHYLSMFAAVGAVGIISGLTLQGSNPYSGGSAGVRAGAGQGLGQGATQILQRFLNRFPTLTIRAGHRLRIWFTSDVLVPRPTGR